MRDITAVLEALQASRLRCTYNALSALYGVTMPQLFSALGEKRPLASWVVNARTLQPTGYGQSQEHPDLYRHSQVLTQPEEIRDLLQRAHTGPEGGSPGGCADTTRYFGVDGCRGGWFYVCLADGKLSGGTVSRVEGLLEKATLADVVFVDIPIGLREASPGGRQCDTEARRLLGPRASSVFNAPIRGILRLPDYQEANTTSRQLTGKGISKQTWNICGKILEVDAVMRADPKARRIIREVHPELCFYGLANGRPMAHNKKVQAGFDQRLEIIESHLPGARDFIDSALAHYPRNIVAADDILDATVAAITASLGSHWQTLPKQPELDCEGLPMEMVYCQR
tara:strand:+ start:5855 stop:6874 length:1020 start_codon:yes stop_codon:yes gene_type:complete